MIADGCYKVDDIVGSFDDPRKTWPIDSAARVLMAAHLRRLAIAQDRGLPLLPDHLDQVFVFPGAMRPAVEEVQSAGTLTWRLRAWREVRWLAARVDGDLAAVLEQLP